ncbi:PPK2 family polyphosphate kinase [Pseudoduganella violaceinigra]|uniref:PPK2 family polyphosphate kinase n=1 Tax=Pseudoduganella violaceinigra TaxID=246602 RepID=UPI0004160B15|nr:PPK2 family polyphosphate kinase [Pseudoduganella violaceinigra]
MKATEEFRARAGLRLRDSDARPRGAPDQAMLDKMRDDISDLQEMLYAEHKRKLLIVLQGTDTSGKDGTVRSLFSKLNPMGLRAVPFKAPTDIELAHDFLWRIHREVPRAGEIAVFNRSHYEDVLITRVLGMITPAECKRRYAQIRDFERMLSESGTTIIKFFLHISKDEQRERLQARADNPKKHWKFDLEDLKQREHWKAYQKVYADAIKETDTGHAPWYVVPADSKSYRNEVVARVVLATLRGMKLDWPAPDPRLLKLKVR